MPQILSQATAVIEGRAPLPARLMPDGKEQLETRQTKLPEILAAQGVHAIFIDPRSPKTYDASGRITTFTHYGASEPVQGVLEPGNYAWRLRDIAWQDGDPAAYPNRGGYNSARARSELATRSSLWRALQEMGLADYAIETVTEPHGSDWRAESALFLKPNIISDIADVGRDPGTRARLITGRDLSTTRIESFAGGAVLQRVEPPLPAADVLDHLGLGVDSPKEGYFHAIRVFSLAGETPAVELRLTNPNTIPNNLSGDIGKLFATELYLLDPGRVLGSLPALTAAHRHIRTAFAARYGENNYLAFDYMIRQDGSVKMVNALVRALTPNLPKPEQRETEAGRLAIATAAIEGRYLANLAIARFAAL